MPAPAERRPLGRAFALALLVAVAATWAPSLPASFQFDDWAVIVDDARVQSLAAWWASMPGIRALTKASWALNHELGGGPAAFRAVNVALHALNAVLVWRLLSGLAMAGGGPAAAGHAPAGRSRGVAVAAAFAAVVFALHPVQTESVTYLSARSNVLMATFALLALLAWRRSFAAARPVAWQAAALAALVAALASKETAAVVPLAMALVAVASFGAAAAPGAPGARAAPPVPVTVAAPVVARRWPRALVAPLLLVAVALAAAVAYLPYDYLLRVSLETRSSLDNLVVQVPAIGWLLGQLVLWQRLNADPALVPATTVSGGLALGALALVAVLVAGLANLRRRPALAFGILWTFLWLAPTNSLLARLDLANERQWYLAIVGPAWLLGLLLARLPPRVALAAGLVLAAVLAAGTVDRNRVYADELRFWSDVVAKSPHNARAWNNLGYAQAIACDAAAAARSFARAQAAAPADSRAAINGELLRLGELPGVPARCLSPTRTTPPAAP